MRWHLLNTFDKIYILDLHGNSKKKETCPDGSIDKNVFDIQPGVSINIFIKTGKKKKGELAKVYHSDVYGTRENKYQFCMEKSVANVDWKIVNSTEPYHFFVPKDFTAQNQYEDGIKIDELFVQNVTGIVTARDKLVISQNRNELIERIKIFTDSTKSDQEIRDYFFGRKKAGKYAPGDSRGWKLPEARKAIRKLDHEDNIKLIEYRPFDIQYIYYHPKMVDWGREKIMRHMIKGENIGLTLGRQGQVTGKMQWNLVSITKQIIDFNYYYRGGEVAYPLYLYPDDGDIETERRPNLNLKMIAQMADTMGLRFTNEKTDKKKTFAPIDVLDYIYGVLHSPKYRETYKEFLKIDFPRVAYPKDAKEFFLIGKIGAELRELHLLESQKVTKPITTYPIDGDNIVGQVKYEDGKVWINEKQYFDKVPEDTYNFYIGGYQPLQKWLKDRKGRELSYDDIMHYQKIVVALSESIKLMDKVDKLVKL